MQIHLENVGKRYLRRWIFRGLTTHIAPGGRVGVTGHNGSGKSTLLKILMGALNPSEGIVSFSSGNEKIAVDSAFSKFAFAAPYTDLIEEMTLTEFLKYHTRFRSLREGVNAGALIEVLGNQFKTNTYLKSYSSGMKQRVRLAVAAFTEASVIVLDEPTSNLDEEGKEWYAALLNRIPSDVTLVIASNDALDMASCREFIHIPDYSPSK